MLWTDVPLHLIDFEGSQASGILEYGVVTLLGGRVVAAEGRLCRATGAVRADDTEVHGLDAAMVAFAAPFSDDFDRFVGWRARGPLGAHFAQAENSLIKSVWPYGREAPDFGHPCRVTAEWGPWVDTGRLYPEVFGEAGRGRLAELVERFGLQAELDALACIHCVETRRRYHAALYDALAAAVLLLALGRRPEFSAMTVPWLLQMSTANPEKREALRQQEWDL